MRRREFITLLGGAVAAWPLVAQRSNAALCGALVCSTEFPSDDPQSRVRHAAFLHGLGDLGWKVGRNLQIHFRVGAARHPGSVAEMVALAPEVSPAIGSSVVGPLRATTAPSRSCSWRSPIRSARASYRACRGRAATSPDSLVRVGHQAKWLALLNETTPDLTRVAVFWIPIAYRLQVCRRDAIGSARSWASRWRRQPPRAGEIERGIDPSRGDRTRADCSAGVAVNYASRANHRPNGPAQVAIGSVAYRSAVTSGGPTLWFRRTCAIPAGGQLRRSHSEGRKASRPTGSGADQVRVGDQPEDREGARYRVPPTLLARADEVIE